MRLIDVIRMFEAYFREYGPGARVVIWCDHCQTWSDEVKIRYRANLGLDKNVNAVTIHTSNRSPLDEEDYRVALANRQPFWRRVFWSIQRPAR